MAYLPGPHQDDRRTEYNGVVYRQAFDPKELTGITVWHGTTFVDCVMAGCDLMDWYLTRGRIGVPPSGGICFVRCDLRGAALSGWEHERQGPIYFIQCRFDEHTVIDLYRTVFIDCEGPIPDEDWSAVVVRTGQPYVGP